MKLQRLTSHATYRLHLSESKLKKKKMVGVSQRNAVEIILKFKVTEPRNMTILPTNKEKLTRLISETVQAKRKGLFFFFLSINNTVSSKRRPIC